MPKRKSAAPDPAAPFCQHSPVNVRLPIDVVREAENKGMWIYHPQSENWYSPAEFMEKYGGMLNYPGLFHNIALCLPEDGLQTLRRLLKDASDELGHLTDRVIEYYRNRPSQGASSN